MKFNVNFNSTPKLVIDNKECIFEQEVKGYAHQTNKSNMLFTNVHWKDFSREERMQKPFVVPTYSVAKFYFGDTLFFYGIAIATGGGSLSPFVKKHANVKIISIDTFLSEGKFMDFVINDEEPEKVLDRILKKLDVNNIIKGEIHFEDKKHIKNYNLQDKTAYVGLDIIAKQTNSTMVFSLDYNENITINYYSKDYLEQYNKGIDIDYTDDIARLVFWNTYGIRDFRQKEINVRTTNVSRMYSDSVLGTVENEKVIDLTTIKDTENTRFPIGKIISVDILKNNGTLRRRGIAITQEQDERNKQGDIVYTVKSKELTFKNDFGLLNLNSGSIKIKYLPIVSFSHQSENKAHQQLILNNSGLEGELTRVEKRNDLTEASDIISQNEHTLNKLSGIHKAFDITSQEPIWEIGQTTDFISQADEYKELIGNYKVKSVKFNFTLNSNGKLKNSIFEYELIKSLDFESGVNFYDTRQYKQNNSFGDKEIFDLKTFETAEILLSSQGNAFCYDLEDTEKQALENELETNMEAYNSDTKVIVVN